MPPNPFDTHDVTLALAGRFQLGVVLRVGGQGMVYKAIRVIDQSGHTARVTVALKLYMDPTQDARVDREIDALRGCRHPNLAYLVEEGRIQVQQRLVRYVAWEFVGGEALDHRVSHGSVPAKTVAAIGRDVARAIDQIWAQRIVHRDVNPKNIILKTGDSEAVLIDLGIARYLDMSSLTAPGATWGTLGYYSPEQCRAERQLTCHSDIFSLAVSLQEALVGRHPTNGDQNRLYSAPPRSGQLDPNMPTGLAELLDDMLKMRAAFRPHPAVASERFAELESRLQ